MHRLKRIIGLLLFVSLASGCSTKEDPPPSTISLLTSGVWTINKVTIDGIDQTSMFSSMTLVFTTNTYTTTKGGLVWPANGTFQLNDNDEIIRNDAAVISIDELSETQLGLSLTWSKNALGSGRINSISGKHTFLFKR